MDLAADDEWLDEQAGPLVRPYVLTGGRGHSPHTDFDLVSLVLATGVDLEPPDAHDLGPEHHRIVAECAEPLAVVDLAATLDLPVGAVRVLVGDLRAKGLVEVQEPEPRMHLVDHRMYEVVLDGLRSL